MRPTVQQLLSWNTHAVSGAGECAERGARELLAALEASSEASHSRFWTGLTHDAALRRMGEEYDHGSELANVLQQITDEAKDAGTDLAHAKLVVEREVHQAMSAGYWVSSTGEVTHIEAAKSDEAKTIQSRIQHGLDVVDDIDERYGARLADLRSDLVAMLLGQPDVTYPGVGPIDADTAVGRLQALSPTERQKVLRGMSPTDIRRLVQANPEVMGNLDGVPFEVRTVANEVNIRNALATELRTHGAGTERAKILRSFLGQRNVPVAGLTPTGVAAQNDPDDHQTERTFVTFRPESLHLVEMVGTLGKGTPNAAVYVPGTGTNAATFSGTNWNSAWHLSQQTHGPVFIYMDGDLPQHKEPQLNRHPFENTAISADQAKAMAPKLVEFSHALRTEIAATSPGATTTYIGHSYGGSIVGTAEQLGLDADNVLHASSAGTGALDGPWHDANPNVKRFSMTAPGDWIQAFQGIPGGPHGGDPDTAPGVVRLDTGFYSDGSLVAGTHAHGGYFDDLGSDAFQNMVKVITGEPPTPYVERESDYAIGPLSIWANGSAPTLHLGDPNDGPRIPFPIPSVLIPGMPRIDFPLKPW